MAKKYANYHDVPEKYRFDLDHLLKGKKIEDLIKEAIKIKQKLVEMQPKIYDSAKNYLASIKLDEEFKLIDNRVSNYLSNNKSVNLINPEINKLIEEYETQMRILSIKAGATTDQFFQNAEKVAKWIKQPEFDHYRLNLTHLINSKKHKVSAEIENYLKLTSKGETQLYDLFGILNYSEMDYGYAIDSKGRKRKINDGNYKDLMKSKDEQLRKSAFHSRSNALFKHRELMAKMLIDQFKKISANALAYKFNSSVEMLIYDDEVQTDLLTTLYENAQKHAEIFGRYRRIRRQAFYKKYGKKYQKWDSYLEITKIKNKYSIDDCQKLILKALKPLGKEYNKMLKKAFSERWIDYCHVENKRAGAYSIGNTYGLEKIYILTNYSDDYDSVSTLAHELGHSMHTYYSNKTQPISLSSYPIFLAEIASVFNQIMLNKYMFEHSKSDQERLFFLEEMISDFFSTVIVQLEFSNYEFELYKRIDQDQPIGSFEDIKKIYHEVMLKYLDKKSRENLSKPNQYKKLKMLYSFTVPHYYYWFYVYKYAVGYICAYAFYSDYEKRGQAGIDNYINNFLSQGRSDWPVKLLQKAGVDLYDPKIYDAAFGVVNKLISQYAALVKKVFKL